MELSVKLILITAALGSVLAFLSGFSKITRMGRLEHWTLLLIALVLLSIVTGKNTTLGIPNDILLPGSILFHSLGYLFSLLKLNYKLFSLMHPSILKIDWEKVKTEYIDYFQGEANISKHNISTTDNSVTYELEFTHPVNKGWYYATFHRSIICKNGKLTITFKKNGYEVVLKEGDILEIEALDIIKLETHTNSVIRVICTK